MEEYRIILEQDKKKREKMLKILSPSLQTMMTIMEAMVHRDFTVMIYLFISYIDWTKRRLRREEVCVEEEVFSGKYGGGMLESCDW